MVSHFQTQNTHASSSATRSQSNKMQGTFKGNRIYSDGMSEDMSQDTSTNIFMQESRLANLNRAQ